MRILLINWRDWLDPRSGGAETYLYEQAVRWLRAGHQVSWITAAIPGRPASETVDGIDIFRGGNRATIYAAAPILYARHGRNADVIIDAENGIPFFSPLFTRKPKVLLIHHVHKNVWFQGDVPRWLGHVGCFLETKVMPRVYRNTPIVTVSASSRDDIRALMPGRDATIIHNGVAPAYVPGTRSPHPEISFLGRLKRYKSVDVLLKAVARTDPALPVNIIGRGDDEPRLRDLATTLGLSGVRFRGFVSDREKVELLQRSWFVVNPSFVEGWSITNIEANACATPVIGSAVPGIRDSVRDGETGFLFPYGDVEALSGHMRRLLSDAELRARLSAGALAWSHGFSWDASAATFLRLLAGLASEKGLAPDLRGTYDARP